MNLKEVINRMELATNEDGETKLLLSLPKKGLQFQSPKEVRLFVEALNLLGAEMDYLNIGLIKKSPDVKD